MGLARARIKNGSHEATKANMIIPRVVLALCSLSPLKNRSEIQNKNKNINFQTKQIVFIIQHSFIHSALHTLHFTHVNHKSTWNFKVSIKIDMWHSIFFYKIKWRGIFFYSVEIKGGVKRGSESEWQVQSGAVFIYWKKVLDEVWDNGEIENWEVGLK